MKRACLVTSLLLALGGCATAPDAPRLAAAGADAERDAYTERYRDGEGDAEPVDPAEQRPAVIPPARPVSRGGGTWIERGPAPTFSAQVRIPPDNDVSGAVHALAAHPSNPDILYAGSVNGGIWRTNNARAARPDWAPLTDGLPSQSIGSVSFDPTDTTAQTLVAGIGRWSNFAQRGDDELGVYRTTDGGLTWTLLGGATLLGQKMVAVEARGASLLAASFNGGLFRSTDTGASWQAVTGVLPAGGVHDLVADRSNPARLYIAMRSGAMFRSEDFGQTWTDITAGLTDFTAASSRVRIAVGAGSAVFAVVVNAGRVAGLYRSPDRGASWVGLDEPAVHPGGQGTTNTALVADPVNSDRVYLAGDRITAAPFTANVWRVDASQPAASQGLQIVDAGASNTTPHADSRAMTFDAAGELLQADDGGIYRLRNVDASTRAWSSVIGNMNVMEVHSLDHDAVSDILMIGTQDNGTHIQNSAANTQWRFINGGDGGDVAIDDRDRTPAGSFRFLSSQNLGGFQRRAFNAANTQTGTQGLAAGVTDPQFVTPKELSVTDRSRLLIGGVNTLYESTNADSATPTFTNLGGPGANRNAMAIGAVGAPEVAYVGRGIQVFRRGPGETGFTATSALPAGAAALTDVAMDPANPATVWAVDDNQVFRSTDSGANWVDITGNLPAVSSVDFRTIEFIPASGATPALVALGTRSGVYVATATSNQWELMGDRLPDVLVFDLRFDPVSRTLHAGTLGRGVWSLQLIEDVVFRNGFEG